MMHGLQTFEIVLPDEVGFRREERRGFICGRFAIHVINYGDEYRITHLPTGWYLTDVRNFRRAVGIAAILNELPDITPHFFPSPNIIHQTETYRALMRQWRAAVREYL